MEPLTDEFIRDVVLPEIERSGGATVWVPTSGNASPALLKSGDPMEPRTWIVGVGPMTVPAIDWQRPHSLTKAVALLMRYAERSVYSGVGFWLDDGIVHVDLVECYTIRNMAVIAAKQHGQQAIYELHSGRCEYVSDLVPA
jgi:hypothetical protein